MFTGFTANKKTFFAFSVILVFLAIVVMITLVKDKEPPQRITKKAPIPLVSPIQVIRGSHPIEVTLYGEVSADKNILLKAPYSGQLKTGPTPTQGILLSANEAIYQMETSKRELDLAILQAKHQELVEAGKVISEKILYLQEKEKFVAEILRLSEESDKKSRSALEIEQVLFSNIQKLYESKNVSNTKYLEAKSTLTKSELKVIESNKQVQKHRDQLASEKVNVTQIKSQLAQNAQQQKIKHLEEQQVKKDLADANISVSFPATVDEVMVDPGERVVAGTALARVSSIDHMMLHASIPDHYFKWLYQGELLKHKGPFQPSLTLTLVNKEFPKKFTGAFIKSIGSRLNTQIRSLPIVIGRDNPVDEQGNLISADLLKPGMYCELTLTLCELQESYLIPASALQKQKYLYFVGKDQHDGKYRLGVIKDFSIEHESSNGVLITIENGPAEIFLLPSKFPIGREGMELYVQ